MASLSQTFDTTRNEIVAAMEQRIDKGDRTKLTRKELDELIAILVTKLVEMNALGSDTKTAIDRLCAAEQELLEMAYPRSSINSVYFPRYTKAIKNAIEAGHITLNGKNSYPRRWTKRNPLKQPQFPSRELGDDPPQAERVQILRLRDSRAFAALLRHQKTNKRQDSDR